MSSLAPALHGLTVSRYEIHPPADLLDALGADGFVWLHDGGGLVTAGVAARVPVAGVRAVLGTLPDAIAVGALAFRAPRAGTLALPARVTRVGADGRAWVTEVVGAPVPAPARGAPPPRLVAVRERGGRAAWRAAVRRVLAEVGAGRVEKVVLAREVVAEADGAFDPAALARRLRRAQPGCVVFGALPGLVGASPELLVRRSGDRVESRPLAGTAPAGAGERLARSAKDAREHALVVDAVVDALRVERAEVSVARREVAAYPDLVHLATRVTGVLRDPSRTALDLALALHPTPAVGGTPRDAALALIDELEPFDRAQFAGPVGWVDGRGDGEWALALRGAQLDGSHARVLAGAGIVAGSDPDAEWDETEAKLAPVLRALDAG